MLLSIIIMLRKGVAAKIWTKIWDSGNLVGGAPQERFWYINFLEFSQFVLPVIELSNFGLVILFLYW